LQVDDLASLAVSLTTVRHDAIPEDAVCILYDEILRRAHEAPEYGFSFRSMSELLWNMRNSAFTAQAIDQSLRPFAEAACAEVARLGPTIFDPMTLADLVITSERLAVSKVGACEKLA
jgi:hypothetical protein